MIKLVDEDQQGKVLSVQCRDLPNLPNQFVWSINQYGAKAYREAFLECLKEHYGEFFDDNKDYEEILEATHEKAENDIKQFIEKHCQKYVQPCLEFQFNAIDL